jgi:hypothetical protein
LRPHLGHAVRADRRRDNNEDMNESEIVVLATGVKSGEAAQRIKND